MATVIQNREHWIDGLKAFLMLTVVFEHIIEFSFDGWKANSWYCFCTSFNMACFFLLAGYTFSFSIRKLSSVASTVKHIWIRIQRLLVPWLMWSLLFPLVFFLMPKNGATLVTVKSKIFNIIQHPDSGLWFLLSLFTIEIVASIILFLRNKVTSSKVVGG